MEKQESDNINPVEYMESMSEIALNNIYETNVAMITKSMNQASILAKFATANIEIIQDNTELIDNLRLLNPYIYSQSLVKTLRYPESATATIIQIESGMTNDELDAAILDMIKDTIGYTKHIDKFGKDLYPVYQSSNIKMVYNPIAKVMEVTEDFMQRDVPGVSLLFFIAGEYPFLKYEDAKEIWKVISTIINSRDYGRYDEEYDIGLKYMIKSLENRREKNWDVYKAVFENNNNTVKHLFQR